MLCRWMMLAAEGIKVASDLLLVVASAAAGTGSVSIFAGASVSRRGHRCGGGLVMDFCSSVSAASCRRPLQRRWGEGGFCAGAAAGQ